MRNRNRSNVLLVEILIAVLFFMLSATVLVRVFVTARNMTVRSGVESVAVADAQNVAESLYAAGDIDQALKLSDQDNHNKRIESILNNPNLTEKERQELYDHEMDYHRQRIEEGMAAVEHNHRNRADCINGILQTFSNVLFNATVFLFLVTPEKGKRTMLP